MSESLSNISSINNTSQSFDNSILDQFLNEDTDNMPNSITTNNSTNNNFTRSNIERAGNTTREEIKQETFDYNNEDGLRGFIDYLYKNSNNIRYIPIGIMSSLNNEIISDQHTAKAKIFDQIADYCKTQPIESKNLKKKYEKMQKEINKIKKKKKRKKKKKKKKKKKNRKRKR